MEIRPAGAEAAKRCGKVLQYISMHAAARMTIVFDYFCSVDDRCFVLTISQVWFTIFAKGFTFI